MLFFKLQWRITFYIFIFYLYFLFILEFIKLIFVLLNKFKFFTFNILKLFIDPKRFHFKTKIDKPIVVSLVAIHNIYIPVKKIIIELNWIDNIEKYIYIIIQNNSHIIKIFKKVVYKNTKLLKFINNIINKKSNQE